MTLEELKTVVLDHGQWLTTGDGRVYDLEDVMCRLAPEILDLVEAVALVHDHGETCMCSVCDTVAKFQKKLASL